MLRSDELYTNHMLLLLDCSHCCRVITNVAEIESKMFFRRLLK